MEREEAPRGSGEEVEVSASAAPPEEDDQENAPRLSGRASLDASGAASIAAASIAAACGCQSVAVVVSASQFDGQRRIHSDSLSSWRAWRGRGARALAAKSAGSSCGVRMIGLG